MSIKTTIHSVFCENVRARRVALGMTQVQVADELGITHPSYNIIETGKCVPSIEQVDRVAKALRTTAAELLTHNAFMRSQKKSANTVAKV